MLLTGELVAEHGRAAMLSPFSWLLIAGQKEKSNSLGEEEEFGRPGVKPLLCFGFTV